MKRQSVLVTGASGFIGREVCTCLIRQGIDVRAATTDPAKQDALHAMLRDCKASSGSPPSSADAVERASSGAAVAVVTIPQPLDMPQSWHSACTGVDAIIHLAGRAHILRETAADPLAVFRAANRDVSVALAGAAVEAGVGRMVFVSSIGVNGDRSLNGPIRETDPPRPHDAYSQSKFEAENALFGLAAESGLEMVVVRPPLVYGGGAKGNFHRLVKLVDLGLPLPLGAVHNARSLVGVENLADALVACAFHDRAAGQVFLVTDGVDWSTPELIRRIAQAQGKRARLIPVPRGLLDLAGRITGQSRALDRLCDSLQVDSSKLRDMLDWLPPLAPEEGLRQAVAWYGRPAQDRR
jgi:nucleoside-diphosphate-sugar epimerase